MSARKIEGYMNKMLVFSQKALEENGHEDKEDQKSNRGRMKKDSRSGGQELLKTERLNSESLKGPRLYLTMTQDNNVVFDKTKRSMTPYHVMLALEKPPHMTALFWGAKQIQDLSCHCQIKCYSSFN